MNEHPNSGHTGEDRADIENRYAKARDISLILFAFCFLCALVFVGAVLTGLLGRIFGDLSKSGFYIALGIVFGSFFLGILLLSAWTFFLSRALFFLSKLRSIRGKLRFEATDSFSDVLFFMLVNGANGVNRVLTISAVVKWIGKNFPVVVRAGKLSKLRREQADLRREREESEK